MWHVLFDIVLLIPEIVYSVVDSKALIRMPFVNLIWSFDEISNYYYCYNFTAIELLANLIK